mmetsp:Transcript_50994/g.85290  ORF Transcript_50994/g.85290 Transcript_50994/m.85290 type:complete len:118 (+) Transcript_50994:455-808(+)
MGQDERSAWDLGSAKYPQFKKLRVQFARLRSHKPPGNVQHFNGDIGVCRWGLQMQRAMPCEHRCVPCVRVPQRSTVVAARRQPRQYAMGEFAHCAHRILNNFSRKWSPLEALVNSVR